MLLYINTTNGQNIEIALKEGNKVVSKTKKKAPYKQAELLLVEIDRILKKNKLKLDKIKEIQVENKGGTFTSLRIGIVTANTLAYALNIPITPSSSPLKKGREMSGIISKKGLNIIKPEYNAPPSIN